MKIIKFVFLGGQKAGKTSILRRYFHGAFQVRPTVGADVYSSIISTSSSSSYTTSIPKTQVSIQVWDTPGRERFVTDKFLRNLDAAILVYDVSSSTSFTHVLNWYYELIERIKIMKTNHDRIRKLPIIIVGNKIDIFEERDAKKLRKKEVVRQRDVLGLTGAWTGKDYRYEYSASPPSTTSKSLDSPLQLSSSVSNNSSSSSSSSSSPSSSRPQQLELLTYYLGTNTKNTNYLEAILSNKVYRGSYLDSLISSEDKSHPDKDMVQLWCMRNGLIHSEVSAKTGRGINKLIHQLVDIALKQTEGNASLRSTDNCHNDHSNNCNVVQHANNKTVTQWNDELDLHTRYKTKTKSCFPFQNYC